MNAVIYYSNTGQSKRIAQYFSEKTAFSLYDIFGLPTYSFDTAILVFPVHCQNIPKPISDLLKRLNVQALIPIATYGKMCYGRVLYEIQKRYNHDITAAAYVPAKHAYISESEHFDYESLNPLLSKISDCTPIIIPKTYKNPLSNLCKGLRSRMGVKIYKNKNCTDCGACTAACNNNAINNGVTNRKCIRCLKCVAECPNNALHFKNRLPMRLYLRKNKINRTVIFI